MNIEQEIFKRSKILEDTLEDYGFQKEQGCYIIKKDILDHTFQIVVEITEEKEIKGKVYDLSFQEEYTNYRSETQTGEFVNKIREEFQNFLIDIRSHCTITTYFVSDQANRIAQKIEEKYHDVPEFAWEKSPGFGIFRNPQNKKWYGLIMIINKNKLDKENKEVEILNIKLQPEVIRELVKKKGYYKAYHMNKENWITILLDNSIPDEEILNYVDQSHAFTQKSQEWILPANPKYYDVVHCFDKTDVILWKQTGKIQCGDLVYIYVTKPYGKIFYQCQVMEMGIPYSYKDSNLSMSKVMKIKLLKRYEEEEITLDTLKKYGVPSVRNQRTISKKLEEFLHSKK